MASKPIKNIQSQTCLLVSQKSLFFNDKLANKTSKAFTKLKTKPESILLPKSKKKHKQSNILELDKITKYLNKTLEEPITFFSRKSIYYFNLKEKNASLQAKIMQNKEKFNWLKAEIRKINTKMQSVCNMMKWRKKLRKTCNLQDKFSKTQKKLALAKQNIFKAYDNLNSKLEN